MINTAQALYQFWSSFGIPAYTVGTVPDEAQIPYITYSLVETEPLDPQTCYAQIWYRTTSNATLLAKVDEVMAVLKTGVNITCDGGLVALRGATVSLMTDMNPENRYAYINMQINCYHL
jgi:hypothetical protein